MLWALPGCSSLAGGSTDTDTDTDTDGSSGDTSGVVNTTAAPDASTSTADPSGTSDDPSSASTSDAASTGEPETSSSTSGPGPSDPVVIQDVVVAYSDQSEEVALSMGFATTLDHAQSMVDETNEIYENSGIIVRLSLAGVGSVGRELESSMSLSDSLLGVCDPDDGVVDEIHELRDDNAADMAVIFLADLCGGFATGVPGDAEAAFAVVGLCPSGTKQYSFAHELGHLQGAHHETVPAEKIELGCATTTLTPWARAHELGGTGTVMHTGDARVPYFSNPDVVVDGEPTGTEDRNNAARINETAELVASWR